MSQENVDLVRGAYAILGDMAGIRRGDYDAVYPQHFAHDLELVLPPSYPDAEPVYLGIDGFKRWLGQMDEIFDEWGFEAEQFVDRGSQVVVLARTSGTAKQSGVPVTIPVAHVHTLRDGRVARVEVFLDRAEALEAAGLSE